LTAQDLYRQTLSNYGATVQKDNEIDAVDYRQGQLSRSTNFQD